MKATKIFFIDPNNMTPQYNYPILEGLANRNDVDITYISSNYSAHTRYYDENYKIPAKYVFSGKIAGISNPFIRKSLKLLSFPLNYTSFFLFTLKKKPDIIHYNWLANPFLDYFFIRLLKIFGRKIVINVHNLLQHENSKLRAKELNIFINADVIVSLSKFTQNLLENRFSLDSRLIPHGNIYDKEILFFTNSRSEIVIHHNSLLFAGGIRPYKGLELLISTFAVFSRKNDFHLYILGNGEKKYLKYLKFLVKQHKISERVHFYEKFLNYRELIPAINSCKMGILPYQEATQSGVIYLFNLLHKPLIVSDQGGLGEQISPKTTEISSLTKKKLLQAMGNMVKRIENGQIDEKDFVIINEEQNISHTIEKYIDLYQKLSK